MDRIDFLRMQKLIEPCLTPEDLDEYIVNNFNIRLPWDIVDENSTSAPLKFIWEINEQLLTGKGSNRHILACARNTGKTLTSSMLQYFSMIHFRRDGAHISAILSQSGQAIGYLEKFLENPLLQQYQKSSNTKVKQFVGLPPNDFTRRSNAKLQVVTATKKGANAPRASCFIGSTLVDVMDSGGMCFQTEIANIPNLLKGGKLYAKSVDEDFLKIEYQEILGTKISKTEKISFFDLDGVTTYCTPDHLFVSEIGQELFYEPISEIAKGLEQIVVEVGGKLKLDYKKISNYRETAAPLTDVYDITVDKNHNFFANQILVHNCLTFDEVDLTPPEILSEAAFIADPSIIEKPDGTTEQRGSIFIYLSSRKSNDGPIQGLIDEAETVPKPGKKRPRLHKWSLADMQANCPPEVHKPELGEIRAFINTETLETRWGEEDYNAFVQEMNKSKYKEYSAYEGCRSCPVWTSCLGRTPKQRGTSPMLRERDWVSDLLDAVSDPSVIIAQSLNWKPETTGIVFKSFAYDKHVKDPIDFYEYITDGALFDPDKIGQDEIRRIDKDGTDVERLRITPKKEDIYKAMRDHGWTVGAGVDWGYDPDPAVCVVAGFHKKRRAGAVLHIEHAKGFANHIWADYIAENIHTRFPLQFVAPDQADPSSITYFQKHRIASLGKKDKPKRIVTGVSFIRGLLWNPQKSKANFAILDDSQTENGNDMMIQAMLHWTHARDPLGRYIMDKFADDKYTHCLDATRYFLHPFTKHKTISSSAIQFARQDTTAELLRGAAQNNPESIAILKEKQNVINHFTQHMAETHGVANVFAKPVIQTQEEETSKTSKSSGGIKFSI